MTITKSIAAKSTDPVTIIPHSLKDTPSLIEQLMPVQKLSAEVFRERKAGSGQTLTRLGSYWKGRKPLILTKACILGCLLPITDDPTQDLLIFEKLMGMDDESFVIRLGQRPSIKAVLATANIENVRAYFEISPNIDVISSAPDTLEFYGTVKSRRRNGIETVTIEPDESEAISEPLTIRWRADIPEAKRRQLEALTIPKDTYRRMVQRAKRPEQVIENVHDHIWEDVNQHLGTNAHSFPELIEQLGIMRFGHRARVADTFSGSGQIPFEAARLGCDVYASDLNPIACMLTWGALNMIGSTIREQETLTAAQEDIVKKVQAEIDRLGIESDSHGWTAKAYLYCLETKCPQTGWMVPLLPTRVISKGRKAIAELHPIPSSKRYDIRVSSGVSDTQMKEAEIGTIKSEGRGQEPYLEHYIDGTPYRTKISTLRGDYNRKDGAIGNRLRIWEQHDCSPSPDDIYQERLYAIQWMKPKENGNGYIYEFRAVSDDDLKREKVVKSYLEENLATWQKLGYIPDTRIEPGEKTTEPIRTRGWSHWHHLFSERHLLFLGLMNSTITEPEEAVLLIGLIDYTSKLCQWTTSSARSANSSGGGRTGGASDNPSHVFYNQALNTFYNYGCRSATELLRGFVKPVTTAPVAGTSTIENRNVHEFNTVNDIYITDPPYGDAVKYEEILEYFIAWMRKNPPTAFSEWVWDSRRTLAIKGEDEDFRRKMVAAYQRMAEMMPDNGIQIIMFTHQSGSIWANMANIVWASSLQVTAAWYVVTETDSPLRTGSYVKGTVLLVVRKRQGNYKTTSDDLAWEIQEEVEEQIETLTGLNQAAKGIYRDDNLFEDADLQMAGYAAALRTLTRYAIINGKEMATEAIRPRVRGETTFVDELIEYAVDVANRTLVPDGIRQILWDRLEAAERFYLKMLDMEAKGHATLDNYQNFAKAFKLADFSVLMASVRANEAKLKSAVDFGRSEISKGSSLYETVLRGVLYATMELIQDVESDEVLAHLPFNIPTYYDQTNRDQVVEIAAYLAQKLEGIRPEEARAARILRELVRNQRM